MERFTGFLTQKFLGFWIQRPPAIITREATAPAPKGFWASRFFLGERRVWGYWILHSRVPQGADLVRATANC